MLRINLLEKVIRNEKQIYKSTEKGKKLLKHYREMHEMLKNNENNRAGSGITSSHWSVHLYF